MVELVRKQFVVTLRFETTVEAITDQRVIQDLGIYANRDQIICWPGTWRKVERQRRLLAETLRHPDVLDSLLRRCVWDFVASALPEADGRLEEIVAPVIAGLEPEDRAFFQGAVEAGAFWENSEHVWERFEVRLMAAEIAKV